MGFSKQEYWSGLPLLSLEDLPNPGIEPGFPAMQAVSLLSEPPGTPRMTECIHKSNGHLLFKVYVPEHL